MNPFHTRLFEFLVKWTHESYRKEVCLVFKARIHILAGDIAASTLYEIERGDTACSVRNAYWISEYLSVPVSYLLDGEKAVKCDCPELNEVIEKLDYGEKKRMAGVIRAFYESR